MSRWVWSSPLLCALGVLGEVGVLLAQGEGGNRYALVVGINEYQHDKLTRLNYCENDVVELGGLLSKGGYRVTLLCDSEGRKSLDRRPTRANIEGHLTAILRESGRGDTVIVALAGHGLQFENQEDAYFCPVDARPFPDETATLVSLGKVYQEMDRSFASVKVLLVDACRDDPNAGRGSRGVHADSAPRPPRGVAALFSCSAGERAFEFDKYRHGVFFHHVLEALRGKAANRREQVTFGSLAEYVQGEVAEEVAHFVGGGARQSPNLKADLSGASPVLLDRARLKPNLPTELQNSIGQKFRLVRSGTFLMGPEQPEAQHLVEITKPFLMGVHEVTQGQYRKVMASNPSWVAHGGNAFYKNRIQGLDTELFPIDNVSWENAVRFCQLLSSRPEEKRAGRRYRLPTEAEWEYACRGGASRSVPYGVGKGTSMTSHDANYDPNVAHADDPNPPKGFPNLGRPAYVGSYAPNAFGLHDMHGNVWEWCSDWYEENYYRVSPRQDPQGPANGETKVLRGGSWDYNIDNCRSARRHQLLPRTSDPDPINFRHLCGFRVVCEVVAPVP